MKGYKTTKVLRIAAVLVINLVLAGCGNSSEGSPEPEGVPEATEPPLATSSVPTEEVDNSADEVAPATAVPPTPTTTTEPIEPTATPPTEANADVLFVSATETAVGLWTFSVTVFHPDTGWEDYADGWDVVLPDGTVAIANPDDPFTRLLLHPHQNEQPFTRSQSNIPIPTEVTTVTVRAHDLVDGFGGQEVMVDLTAVSGENFEVSR